ncbi:unnamed protein product, partial [Ectocarpus sp. 6 AP-2014]
MAVVETVAAGPGALTIKTRKVSSEERQMAGAPQGEIFDVVALTSSEVPASVDVSKDLEAVRTHCGVSDWACLFAAVSSARTLLLHHRDMFGGEDGGPGLIGRLVSLVADAVSNRRSVVQTNGLRCLGEMFSCVVGKEMTADQMGTLVRSTLSCHKSSSKFCGRRRRRCGRAMEAALANADPEPLLSAALPLALDRHPKVACRGLMCTAECLSRLLEGSVAGRGLVDGVDVKSVVAALAKGASSRDSDGKEAAWRGVEMCRKALGEDAFEATIAEHVDRKGVRAIHDLVSGKVRKHSRIVAAAAAAGAGAAGGTATAGRSGVRSRRRVADGGAFGKPAARGGLGVRDRPTTGGDGGFGGGAHIGGPAGVSDQTLARLSSSCDREAGSGGAGGAGVCGFGGGMWTGTATRGVGEPWTKDTGLAVSSATGARGGERPRPLQPRKGSSGEQQQRQEEEEEGMNVSSVGARGEERARCWEDAVATTPAKGTPDQCPERHVESDDEGPAATGGAVMLGEPITDSKVLMAVRMPEATASAEADVSCGGGAGTEHEASGGLEKASGEVPVFEATAASEGLVVEVDGARLQAIEE